MAQFQPGNVPQNKGISRSRSTRSRISAANDAITTCRTGGKDPIAIQIDCARFLFGLAAKIQKDAPEAFDNPMGHSQKHGDHWTIVDRAKGTLESAANMANRVSEFAYPKLARYDHIGDAPVNVTQNKVVVTLNVGGAAPPPGIVPEHTIDHVDVGEFSGPTENQ